MPFKDPEKKKEYDKQYYQKNKEKLLEKAKEQQKIYRQENKDKIKENNEKYRQENKEKIKENNEKYRQENKEKIKIYYQENKDKIKEQQKEYKQTENCIKSMRISKWKNRGVYSDDYDKLYEIYINTTNCEKCSILLTTDKLITNTTKCLDHNHQTGLFRYVLCNRCNLNLR